MSSKIRIASLALGLGLIGAVTAVWGAESVINLISQGETIVAKVKSTKAAQEALTKKNNDMATEGPKLNAESKQLQADVAAYQKQADEVKAQTADYKAKCEGKTLNQQEYKACKAQLDTINQMINQVNAQPPKLNQRSKDLQTRAAAYNGAIKEIQEQGPKVNRDYSLALTDEEQWIDRVRTFLLSPAVQPYAKKAGCPDVEKPAKNIEGVNKMSIQALACLKKIAGTG
ncbi:MAG TPA: hypothetical protein VFL15_04070 [Gammaproteobacteria bacterium]|nr:hypothetical protein [Gammaproteobacteria bacterium]